MRELFIYYRVKAVVRDEALAAVKAMQAQLRARHPQLLARLLQREDATADLHTWMETYSTEPQRDPQGVSDALEAEIAAAARVLQPFIEGARHTEVFQACAS